MTNKKEITAGIIIIGNEVLSGRTKDINTSTLAKWLNSLGIEVKEVRVIPDLEFKIVETVNHLRKKFNYIFTTGGIGPTHDDITAESISKAFNLEYLTMRYTKSDIGYERNGWETINKDGHKVGTKYIKVHKDGSQEHIVAQ